MNAPSFEIRDAHRWFAVECNNRTWDLLEKSDRTADEDAELVHAAHASGYHWQQVGTTVHRGRALYMIANAHAAVGQGDAGKAFGAACLQLMEAEPDAFADWDVAFAHDALARAIAAAGEEEAARAAKDEAAAIGARIADADDKSVFDGWHQSGNWHGLA